MGGSLYSGMSSISEKSYAELASRRKSIDGVEAFTHTSHIMSGKAEAKVHERLDPSAIKFSAVGKRESRDVDENKPSNAIAVMFDVTGSMRRIPVVLQSKLTKLMSTILVKGVVENPQILFGAVGDVNCDNAPIQVGQFESDLAMDEDVDKFYLEGGGGPGGSESYELAMFFLARLTSTDCYEKRGKKGYAFLIGDEQAYDQVSKKDVKKVFGDVGLQDDIPLENIVSELKEKYEVFFILPEKTSYGFRNKSYWQQMFGQNVITISDENLICETIVSAIGMCEGTIDEVDELASELGLDDVKKATVKRALSGYRLSKNSLAVIKDGFLTVSDSEDGIDM